MNRFFRKSLSLLLALPLVRSISRQVRQAQDQQNSEQLEQADAGDLQPAEAR